MTLFGTALFGTALFGTALFGTMLLGAALLGPTGVAAPAELPDSVELTGTEVSGASTGL